MTQEYNRDVCLFCPYPDECQRLRTVVNCVPCPESLVCAGTPIFNTPRCEPRAREWRKVMPVAAGCLLAHQLLEHRDDLIPVEPDEKEDTALSDGADRCIRCPRCNNTTGGYTSSYDLNIESVFHPQETVMNRQYRLWCNFCGLDVQRTLA